MSINIVVKAEAPAPPYTCELVSFQTQATPFALYGLWLKSQRYFWASPDDWEVARSLLAQVGSELLMPCGTDIVNAIDRLYNLVDMRLVGLSRSVTGTGTDVDPFIYDPPLEQAATFTEANEGSAIYYGAINLEAWQNLLNGEHSSNWSDNYKLKVQIQELIDQDTADDADISTIITALTAAGVDLDALLLLLA